MNQTDSADTSGRKLTTADLAAAGRQTPPPVAVEGERPEARLERERIERLEREHQNEQADEHAVHRFEMEQRAQRADDDRQNDSAEERDRAAAREQHRAESSTVRAGFPWTRPDGTPTREREKLEPLFPQDVAERYRSEWAAVQSSFVDDPKQAAARGDELVAQVMKGLAESFAHEREQLEQELSRSGEASTETLRIGFRRYRSFFERLLAL